MLRQLARRFGFFNRSKTMNLTITKVEADPSVKEGEPILCLSKEDHAEYEVLAKITKSDFEFQDSLIKTRDGYQRFKEFIAEKDLELWRLEREVDAAKDQVKKLKNPRKVGGSQI